jgi:GT2 family glycosyltransferase
LEQCLNSVSKAMEKVSGEVFVVDNNSIDGSVEMVRSKFPDVQLIANTENFGFSKANNQAMRIAKGEYILLLNPDTVVEEDTFSKVVQFMDDHKDAGGLGVRMIDGKGKFLPESKRGLPTPAVAFYKIFGLSTLFPRSKKFGQYHLGYLDEFQTHKIQILSGAFMLMRKEALKKVGLLDEAFFMYGEDIDLSYRITKGGYNNYYFPETRIIHYKGESTKKSSVNYVFVFYRAMVIFAAKHFSQKNAKLFSLLINAAIYFRASVAVTNRFIKKLILPLIDTILIAGGLMALTNYWKINSIEFPESVLKYAIPVYTIIWIISNFFSGSYDRPIRSSRFAKGTFTGLLIILIVYALLPKSWQFSRLFILTGALWTFLYFIFSRIFLHFFIGGSFSMRPVINKRFAIAGSKHEFERISDILKNTGSKIESIMWVSTEKNTNQEAQFNINQLDQIIHIHKIDEVIFAAKDNTAAEIIQWMSFLPEANIDFKIAQPDTLFLIGSNSIETAGDLYVVNVNAIQRPENVRAKRTFDLLVSTVSIIVFPITFWLFKNPMNYFKNLFSVFRGKLSFVGYSASQDYNTHQLPKLKSGILSPIDRTSFNESDLAHKLNLIYARDYNIQKDISILMKAWKLLDRNTAK